MVLDRLTFHLPSCNCLNYRCWHLVISFCFSQLSTSFILYVAYLLSAHVILFRFTSAQFLIVLMASSSDARPKRSVKHCSKCKGPVPAVILGCIEHYADIQVRSLLTSKMYRSQLTFTMISKLPSKHIRTRLIISRQSYSCWTLALPRHCPQRTCINNTSMECLF